MALACAHRAAASWERAVLAVQTNTTRGHRLDRRRQEPVERGGHELDVGAAPVGLGPVPRMTRPARSSTPRWWASRFEAIPRAHARAQSARRR